MIAKFTKKDRLIWWMASVWLIIDSITGLFISYGASMPLSQIFKLIILILIIDKLVYKKYILILTFSILIYLTVYIIHLNINSIGFSEPLVILSKFLSLIYLYLYLDIHVNYSQRNLLNILNMFLLLHGLHFQ